MSHVNSMYVVKSISSRTEFFALVRSLVTIPSARGIIPKVAWAGVLKTSFLCASCVTQLYLLIEVQRSLCDYRDGGFP